MTLLIFSLCSSSRSPWCRPPRCTSLSVPLPLPAFDSVAFYVFVLVFTVCPIFRNIFCVSWPALYIVFCILILYPERQKRNTLVSFLVLTNIIALVAHQVFVFLCLYFRLCSEILGHFWISFLTNRWHHFEPLLKTDLNIWNIIESSWTIDLNNWTHSTA